MDGETFEPDEIGPPYTHFVEDKISYKGKKYKLAHNCAQKDIAARLGIDESKVSKILHHRIEGFSTDSLISLYEKLDPNVRLKVGWVLAVIPKGQTAKFLRRAKNYGLYTGLSDQAPSHPRKIKGLIWSQSLSNHDSAFIEAILWWPAEHTKKLFTKRDTTEISGSCALVTAIHNFDFSNANGNICRMSCTGRSGVRAFDWSRTAYSLSFVRLVSSFTFSSNSVGVK